MLTFLVKAGVRVTCDIGRSSNEEGYVLFYHKRLGIVHPELPLSDESVVISENLEMTL